MAVSCAASAVTDSSRSMPAQKVDPSASSRIAPTPGSFAAESSAPARSAQSEKLSALRFSGRSSATLSSRPSRLVRKEVLLDIDFQREQCRAKGFALRIHAQRQRAASPQRTVQQEVQRAEVR